jgi:hypothetical protein
MDDQHRVVLTERQVVEHGLPENAGKEKSPDMPEFVARSGETCKWRWTLSIPL